MSSLVDATDDYEAFCEGVRALCAVDLSQYKRGQMERRIRSFARRKGRDGLADYLGVLRAETDELDEFLDRLALTGQATTQEASR